MIGLPRGAHRSPRPKRLVPALVAAAATTFALVVVAPNAGAVVGVPTTYEDFSYASTVKTPSENKPQSKLWYTDGSWWALMVAPGGTAVHIFRLNRSNHTWSDTGTVVDTRLNSTGDALWTESIQTLSVVSRDDTSNARVARFTYNAGTDTYQPVSNETVDTGGGSESAAIDRDSDGRLWITYTRASKLWVAHSGTGGTGWTAGYNPAVGDYTLKGDDISSVVAFNGSIGIMWSDQQSNAIRFAIHQNGADDQDWTVEDALTGTRMADDHINLKQVANASGKIYAAIKTSQGDDPSDPVTAPLVGVLVRTPNGSGPGTWKFVQAGTVADDHTRPIIMIDKTNDELYFFATAPVSGGDIYYKKTSLADPDFSNQPGRGQKFVDATPVVNNASGAKDPVTAESGMVILAVAEGKKKYVHAEMDLPGGGGGGGGDTEKPTAPPGLTGTPASDHVDLTWGASGDNVGVTGYVVARDGSQIGTTGASSRQLTDGNVSPGATYTYTVRATDAAGNLSDPSSVTVTVPGNQPPGSISSHGAATARNTGEKTLVVPVPSGAQQGDVLLASVDYRGKASVAPPAGWQLVRKDVNGTAMQKATFVKVAGSSEPASYTWTFSAKPTAVGTMLAYAGVSTSAPVQASSGGVTASSKDVTAPTVTASGGSVVVGLFGLARAATITNPGGMTELTEITSAAGTSYPMTAESAAEGRGSGGSTGPRVAHASVSGPSIGQLVVLNPAG